MTIRVCSLNCLLQAHVYCVACMSTGCWAMLSTELWNDASYASGLPNLVDMGFTKARIPCDCLAARLHSIYEGQRWPHDTRSTR